jgi:AraC-like DNA-binding protein
MNIFEPLARSGDDASGFQFGNAAMRSISGFKVWKDFVHDNFPGLELGNRGGQEFQARVVSQRFAGGVLTAMELGASEVHRTRRLADASEAGFIKIMAQMSGHLELEQDRHSCLLMPGQATVCDTARPYGIRIAEASRFAVLMIPYEACPGWEHISRELCGRVLPESATVRAALAALSTLEHGEADAAAQSIVARAAQWMLSTSLTCSASVPALSGVLGARLDRAERYIEQNLGNPGLDADALARALCMSRRALYMLFQQYRLTPTRLIQEIRLRRAREALNDLAYRQRKITDLAFDCGFNDYATFSRLFKQQYGLSPRDYRLSVLAPHH